MSRQQHALKTAASPAEQPHGRGHRSYTTAKVCADLGMSRRTFYRLRALGRLPFLEELQPRLGRVIRYRADLVDRYLEGQWGPRRFFGSARKVS